MKNHFSKISKIFKKIFKKNFKKIFKNFKKIFKKSSKNKKSKNFQNPGHVLVYTTKIYYIDLHR